MSIINDISLYLTFISPIIIIAMFVFVLPEIRYRIFRIDYHPYFILTKNGALNRYIIKTKHIILGKIIKHSKTESYLFKDDEKYIVMSKGRVANVYRSGNPKPIDIKEGISKSEISDRELTDVMEEKITHELGKLHVTKTDMLLVFLVIISIGSVIYLFSEFNTFVEQYNYDISILKNITNTINNNNIPPNIDLAP